MPSFWSVERDGGTVIATCPEALRYQSDDTPDWMASCAAAIRDELKLLEIEPGTLLEATLVGAPPPGADLEDVLLYNVGVPASQVHAGVRLRRLPPGRAGVVQRYRRVPVAVVESEESGPLLAAVRVPLIDGMELESASAVWLAVRQAVVAQIQEGAEAPPGGIELRIRLTPESEQRRGSTELVKKLLDGVSAAFHVHGGANLEEVARRLAHELGGEPESMRALASSRSGAVLGASDCFWLRGERVQVGPADDRIQAAEIAFVSAGAPQIAIELRGTGAE